MSVVGTPATERTEWPTADAVRLFACTLVDYDAVVHIRRPRGDDVNAACGQLREQFVQVGTKL